MDGMSDITAAREGRIITAIPEDTYAHRLILARSHAGHLSIREAAEKCGLNHASWANWERGTRSRSILDDAEAVAEGLGVDRDWLLHGGPLTRPVRIGKLNERYGRRRLRARRRRARTNGLPAVSRSDCPTRRAA